jgi:hypothetical protein
MCDCPPIYGFAINNGILYGVIGDVLGIQSSVRNRRRGRYRPETAAAAIIDFSMTEFIRMTPWLTRLNYSEKICKRL